MQVIVFIEFIKKGVLKNLLEVNIVGKIEAGLSRHPIKNILTLE